jgi:phage terminase large subunit-like protein
MAYTTINKSSDYFNTKLWTGNSVSDGSNQTITGVGFQPDFFWTKIRSASDENHIRDIHQGNTSRIRSNNAAAANTSVCSVVPNSDGFAITGDDGLEFNYNGSTYVTWNWRGAGSTSSNTDGSITSTVSVNQTSGVSIVTYTGTGSTGTIGHGLNSTPKMIIVKDISGANQWGIYHSALGATKYILLDSNGAAGTASTLWNDTEPTSSVFTVGTTTTTNGSGATYVAYCFAEVQGFSKAISYQAYNGATRFLYTGFKPAFFISKATSNTESWSIYDNKRLGYNLSNYRLIPNSTVGDQSETLTEFLSNGINLVDNANGHLNYLTYTYVGFAFAENPLVSSTGTPCTAR